MLCSQFLFAAAHVVVPVTTTAEKQIIDVGTARRTSTVRSCARCRCLLLPLQLYDVVVTVDALCLLLLLLLLLSRASLFL